MVYKERNKNFSDFRSSTGESDIFLKLNVARLAPATNRPRFKRKKQTTKQLKKHGKNGCYKDNQKHLLLRQLKDGTVNTR